MTYVGLGSGLGVSAIIELPSSTDISPVVAMTCLYIYSSFAISLGALKPQSEI